MSEQEQFQIVGRLVLELAEVQRRAAFIRQELELIVKALDALVTNIRPRTAMGPFRHLEISDYATKYMDISKLLALTAEQDQVMDRCEQLRCQLAELGA